ncbi:hypothetical protein H5410_030240 [Solanum commersonii]|uniref:Uncharacterized protein n=1 Tax=Solanum commersonii TaxID=4109 RepID=A0A9J5YIR2_SOLCO|nr:hypothetical protein H5410_030240 [Solanum commersonii]
MGFWEPSIVTFKFLDFEITPTLEEFSSLVELPIRGRLPVIPSTICTGDFLSLLDLHIFRSLRYVDGGHVELDYLFQRFGHSKVSLEWIRNLQAEWESSIDLEIREESWCTPEYYAWWNTMSHMAHPSAHGHSGFVDRQQIDWIRGSIVPGSIDYLIQEKYPEEDSEENPEEDLEEDSEKDPEEEVWEGHIEVSEMGSKIYDPRDEGVIDISSKHSSEESPEYHPGPYYDVGDNDDAPTWP